MHQTRMHLFAQIAIGLLALVLTMPLATAGDFLYASTTATQSYTTFVGSIPITGLSIPLPAASANFNTAVVTLSMPNLFLSDSTSKTIPMSAQISVIAPFSPQGILASSGGIGCDNVNVKTSGLKPLTIVTQVPLGATSQIVEAEWQSNGTSTVTTSTFASISAILVKE